MQKAQYFQQSTQKGNQSLHNKYLHY